METALSASPSMGAFTRVFTSPTKFDSSAYPSLVSSSSAPTGFALEPEHSIIEPMPAPTQVLVRCSVHGDVTIDQLHEGVTVETLKQTIMQRLKLPPGRLVHLSSWGRELPDNVRLQECRLRNNCMLNMKTSLTRLDSRSTLERVRITSTVLETVPLPVDRTVTGLDLKRKIEAFLTRGEHEWYDNKTGGATSACGATVLTMAKEAADEKLGTSTMKVGEQLVLTTPFAGEGKGKPINAIRTRTGKPVVVMDSNIVLLTLPPEKQRLWIGGQQIDDNALLWDVGVRHDDAVMLEFESPTMPAILQLLRAPDKPKGSKGKGGKGKGGKKKK